MAKENPDNDKASSSTDPALPKNTAVKELELLLTNIEEAYLLLDTKLHLLSFNQQANRLYQKHRGKELVKGDAILAHQQPWQLAELQENYRRILEGSVHRDEVTLPDDNGNPLHYMLKYTPAKSDDGQVIGVFITIRDITTEKAATAEVIEKLRAEQESKLALINSTDDLIWSVNDRYELLAANEAFIRSVEKTAGVTVHPGSNLLIEAKFSPAWLDYWKELYNRALAGESFRQEIFTAVSEDQAESWAEINFSPIRHQNNIIGIACHSRDVTHRKQVEEKAKEVAFQRSIAAAIVNSSEDAIISKDLNGRVTTWNAGAEKIFGYTAEEMIGRSILTIIPPELSEEEQFIIAKVKKGQYVHHYETERLDKQGNRKIVSISVSPILSLSGEVMGAAKIARDITRQRQDAIALQQNEARLKGIIASQTSYIIRTDLQGRYTYYNNKFFDDFGWIYEKESLLGESGMDSILPYHHAAVSETVMKCMAHPNTVNQVEIDKPQKNGGVRTTLWDFTCLVNQLGEPTEMQCVGIDVTDRVKAERSLIESLEEKSRILESIGDAFFAVDKDWIVTYWNRNAERLLGVTKSAVLGKNIWQVFPDRLESTSQQRFFKAVAENEVQRFEDYYQQLDAWYEVSAFPSESGLSVFFKDITEKKKSEEALRESNNRFNLAALATNDVIWDWNIPTGRVVRSADNMQRVFGYTSTEQYERFDFWMSKVHPEDAERIREQFAQHFSDPQKPFMDCEYRFMRADGSYAFVYDKGYIMRDEAGTPVRMIGAVQDVTKLKENEQLLQKKADELARSNKELEQFAFVASHDLQEPLRMVTGFLSQLKKNYEKQLDQRAKTYIDFAVDGATRMRQIIMDLLEYSRVGKLAEKEEAINIEEMVTGLLDLFQQRIEETGAQIIVHQLPTIRTSRSPLHQLFRNLINNALKYTKPGVAPVIHVRAQDRETHWEFSVTDNGIGIDPEYFEKIFIIFQRLHNREAYPGTGIGLSIAKKIVERLGGRIWVESAEGSGSTFFFTIQKTTGQPSVTE